MLIDELDKMSKDEFKKAFIRRKYFWGGIVVELYLDFLTNKEVKNTILINLFEEDDETVAVVFEYWNETINCPKRLLGKKEVDFFNEIMETYHRTVITDKWADEVGEKYYY